MLTISSFQEKMKKKGIDFSYTTKNDNFPYKAVLTFSDGKTIGLKGRSFKETLYIHPIEECDFGTCSEEQLSYISYLFSFFEEFSREKKLNNLFLYFFPLLERLPKNVVSSLFSTYDFLSGEHAYSFDKQIEPLYIVTSAYVKSHEESKLILYTKACQILLSLMQTLHEQEPLFFYNGTTIAHKNEFRFHYQDYKDTLFFLIEENHLVLSLNSSPNKKIKTSLLDLKTTVTTLLQGIKNQQRIKFLMQPKHFYFTEVLARTLRSTTFHFEKPVFEILSRYHSPTDIAIMCANSLKNETYFNYEQKSVCLFRCGNFVFLAKRGEIIDHDIIDHVEEMFVKYEKIILDSIAFQKESLQKKVKKEILS